VAVNLLRGDFWDTYLSVDSVRDYETLAEIIAIQEIDNSDIQKLAWQRTWLCGDSGTMCRDGRVANAPRSAVSLCC